jgi:hypothetical protein
MLVPWLYENWRITLEYLDEVQLPDSFQGVLGRGRRNKQTARMATGIAQDMLGSDISAD